MTINKPKTHEVKIHRSSPVESLDGMTDEQRKQLVDSELCEHLTSVLLSNDKKELDKPQFEDQKQQLLRMQQLADDAKQGRISVERLEMEFDKLEKKRGKR